LISTFHIVVAMKPLDGNFVQNALKHGVAGINVDGTRIGTEKVNTHSRGRNTAFPKRPTEKSVEDGGRKTRQDLVDMSERLGRWPANVILEEGCLVMDLFPTTQQSKGNYVRKTGSEQFLGAMGDGETNAPDGLCDSGSAARFFKQVREI
jgi:hypothetical protein